MERRSQKPIKGESGKGISAGRRIVFAIFMVLIPLILFASVELALRIIGYGEKFPLFIETVHFDQEYRLCNPSYGKKYFLGETYTSPTNDMFLKTKPENGFRVFVIGSSTVYGFPYGSGVMFSRILHQRLQDSYPDRFVEVVNIAITAVNSYTFADRIDEILKQEPDAILIYAGHNEFYGALGIGSHGGLGSYRFVKRLHIHLINYRLYQALHAGISSIRQIGVNVASDQQNETATLMERIVKNRDIDYQGRIYKLAHRHYRANMRSILRRAHRQGVPLFYSEVISNVRDLPPFGSSTKSGVPSAIDTYKAAKELDNKGLFSEARTSYILAKDFDCIRFRASEDLNHIIRELSQQYSAHLVPMIEAFERESPQGIIGDNLLTEHVHPNVDGFFLMADAFYNAIAESKVLGVLDSAYYQPSSYYRKRWGFTSLDSVYAHLRLQQLMGGWPFKPDTLINSFIVDYKPQDVLDSSAFMALRYADFPLEAAHRRMAGYYQGRNQLYKAAQEYRAITKIDPWRLRAFFEAANLYMAVGEYDYALEVLLSSLRITREKHALFSIRRDLLEGWRVPERIGLPHGTKTS